MGELEILQGILQELIAGINQVVASGENIPEEAASLLANEITFLSSRISELESLQPAIPPLQDAMPSSVVNAFNYDPRSESLLVQFKGKWPNEKGPIYSYAGVPKQIFQVFKEGAIPAKTTGKNRFGAWWRGKFPSIGAAMNVFLKQGGFPYQRLT